MKIGDSSGTPRVTPVAEVGDRKPRVPPRAPTGARTKEDEKPPRDQFLATGAQTAPAQPLVYDRSVQWRQQIFTEKGDGGRER